MAAGILAAQSGSISKNTPATIYTCPAGVSHAVVHIFFAQNFGATPSSSSVTYLYINGNPYYSISPTSPVSWYLNPVGASLMLSPGDVISVEYVEPTVASPTFNYSVHVSGYTVP